MLSNWLHMTYQMVILKAKFTYIYRPTPPYKLTLVPTQSAFIIPQAHSSQEHRPTPFPPACSKPHGLNARVLKLGISGKIYICNTRLHIILTDYEPYSICCYRNSGAESPGIMYNSLPFAYIQPHDLKTCSLQQGNSCAKCICNGLVQASYFMYWLTLRPTQSILIWPHTYILLWYKSIRTSFSKTLWISIKYACMRRPWTSIGMYEFFLRVNTVSWWQAAFEWGSV